MVQYIPLSLSATTLSYSAQRYLRLSVSMATVTIKFVLKSAVCLQGLLFLRFTFITKCSPKSFMLIPKYGSVWKMVLLHVSKLRNTGYVRNVYVTRRFPLLSHHQILQRHSYCAKHAFVCGNLALQYVIITCGSVSLRQITCVSNSWT
jgi:hypothetical protein